MSEELIKQIISEAFRQEISNSWQLYLFVILLSLIAGSFGQYITSYYRERGKNFATKTDFENNIKQLKEITSTTESIKSDMIEKLNLLKHEFDLSKSAFDQHLNTILEYYIIIYKHYRASQDLAHFDQHRARDGTITQTSDTYKNSNDSYLKQITNIEGKIRLIFPDQLLLKHDDIVVCNNKFRDIFWESDVALSDKKEKLLDQFKKIHTAKNNLESSLKEFLRTENLLISTVNPRQNKNLK